MSRVLVGKKIYLVEGSKFMKKVLKLALCAALALGLLITAIGCG